jgi:hypothetical protein
MMTVIATVDALGWMGAETGSRLVSKRYFCRSRAVTVCDRSLRLWHRHHSVTFHTTLGHVDASL